MSSGPASPTTEVGDPVAATSGGAGAPEASDTVGPSDAAARRRRRGPYSAAALFVLPYLLLMLAWAGSNPPGASADEADHLVKALGVGRLHIGEPFRDPVPASARRLVKRNASISRVVRIPARLAPDGFKCTAFHPERTAACLPKTASRASGTVLRATPVGSYPPFLYFPLGFVADLATTPTQAFLAARFVSVLMASLLLFAGAFHLVRWLGRRALLGAFVGLTPMALFASAMVSTGGVEICAAFAVAAVGVVAIRRRESLLTTATQLTLAGAGVALILSRQLGSVAFAAIIVLVVLRIGWRATWE
ncbi:MAG: DUF2142 domain-containing protein, partial [Actinomycetota bacterium]|nr:DUF2142 domain-containing protein [Actinomycetota bacterium]